MIARAAKHKISWMNVRDEGMDNIMCRKAGPVDSELYIISIHALLREGRQPMLATEIDSEEISIHALLREGRPLKSNCRKLDKAISIHALLREGRLYERRPLTLAAMISIHALLREGRQYLTNFHSSSSQYFNPRPSARRATFKTASITNPPL